MFRRSDNDERNMRGSQLYTCVKCVECANVPLNNSRVAVNQDSNTNHQNTCASWQGTTTIHLAFGLERTEGSGTARQGADSGRTNAPEGDVSSKQKARSKAATPLARCFLVGSLSGTNNRQALIGSRHMGRSCNVTPLTAGDEANLAPSSTWSD
jgi:hypothetical protein